MDKMTRQEAIDKIKALSDELFMNDFVAAGAFLAIVFAGMEQELEEKIFKDFVKAIQQGEEKDIFIISEN